MTVLMLQDLLLQVPILLSHDTVRYLTSLTSTLVSPIHPMKRHEMHNAPKDKSSGLSEVRYLPAIGMNLLPLYRWRGIVQIQAISR